MKEHGGELGAIAHPWFEGMRNCGDEVRELLHDGCSVASLGDAAFGYVDVFKWICHNASQRNTHLYYAR